MTASRQRRARHSARQHALQALYLHQFDEPALEEVDAWIAEQSTEFDRSYFDRLVRGIRGRQAELDTLCEPYLDRPLAQIDPVEHAILWIGCFELRYIPELDTPVILNEAVELAREFGAGESYRYINGVLDRLARTLVERSVSRERV
ncbi:MAG: transcription antitermination factor NusB [Gammaproteobacteria bacterium]